MLRKFSLDPQGEGGLINVPKQLHTCAGSQGDGGCIKLHSCTAVGGMT